MDQLVVVSAGMGHLVVVSAGRNHLVMELKQLLSVSMHLVVVVKVLRTVRTKKTLSL